LGGGALSNQKKPDPIQQAISAFSLQMEKRKARGYPYGAYGDALDLVRAMEDRLSTRKAIPLKRFILIPLYLWLRGFEQIAINYGRFYLFAFGLGIAGLAFTGMLPIEMRPQAELLTLALNVFTAFTLVFAAPSTYCSSGTNEKHVHTIKLKFNEWEIDSISRTDLILKNVRVFEERVKRRLLVYRWLLGAGWALYFSPILAEAAKAWGVSGGSLTQLASLFPPFAFLVALFVMVEAYARGVDILFRSIELGCNEHLSSLDKHKHV
jgi:hypothetical protein